MYIENIVLSNFRAITQTKFEFHKNFNLIYGENAQGKTSIIEAIYFLASGKSFRTRKAFELITNTQKRATVFSKIDDQSFSVELLKDKKNFYINKEKQRYIEYIGKILAVSFSPEDASLIIDSPETRRRFFNYEISQINKNYLKKITDFQKLIKTRNKLLKEGDVKSPIFAIYNQKYIEHSVDIYLMRKEYIENLSKKVSKKYEEIFGSKKSLKIEYVSFLNFKEKEKDKMIKEFENHLEKRLEKELIFGFSLQGPQKDDFVFYLGDEKVKSYASQGEKKSFIFSLKLAQIDDIKEKTGENPIFLLDDITAYFDENRKKRVFEYFSKKEIQCFFTATEKIEIDGKMIYIKNGKSVEE